MRTGSLVIQSSHTAGMSRGELAERDLIGGIFEDQGSRARESLTVARSKGDAHPEMVAAPGPDRGG